MRRIKGIQIGSGFAFVCLLVLMTSDGWGAQSIQWGTQRGLVDTSGMTQVSNVESFLVEFHVHDLGAPPNGAYFFWSPSIRCELSAQMVMLCGFHDVTGAQVGGAAVNLAGRPDVRVRIQLASGKDQISVETWNGDFSGYTLFYTSTLPTLAGRRFSLAQPYTIAGVSWQTQSLPARMAFFRVRSSGGTIGAAAPTSSNARLIGDVLSYEFEGNLTDSSGGNRTLTLQSGAAQYATTPEYGVATSIRLGNLGVGVLGTPMLVESVTSTDRDIQSVAWEQVSGPLGLTFANASAPSTTMKFRTGGSYTIRLTVRTAGLISTREQTFGVVAEARSGEHLIPIDDPQMEFLLGPVTRSGTSPWPWYDTTERGVADRLGPIIPQQPPGFPANGPGTISIALNGTTVIGSGTSFLSTFQCNNTDWIMVHYPVIGGGTGLRPLNVVSCQSDTQMTVGHFHGENVVATNGVMTGASYSRFTEVGFWANGSNNINYYDNVQAYYRLFYRTGDEIYRTYARRLADAYWKYPLDEGRSCTEVVRGQCSPTRVWGLTGIMARALDGRPEMWPGIMSLVNDCFRSIESGYDLPWTDVRSTYQDTRENGYCFLYMTELAGVHPDAQVRAVALGKAQMAAARFWRPRKRPDGSWRVTQYDQSWQGQGAQPWTHAYALFGLAKLYQLTGDQSVLEDFLAGVQFLWDYGRHVSCRGMLYSVFYTQIAGGAAPTCTFANGSVGPCHTNAVCTSPSQAGEARTLASDIIAVFGLAYALTGNAAYRDMGDEFFSAAYGAAGGPGSDGGKNEFDAVILGGTSFLGKQFGMNAGAGRAGTYLALRQGSILAPEMRTIYLAFDLSAYPNATSVRFTVIYPSGYRVERTCANSPCAVPVDGRHRDAYLLVTEYLSSNGEVISSNAGQPAPLRID